MKTDDTTAPPTKTAGPTPDDVAALVDAIERAVKMALAPVTARLRALETKVQSSQP